MPRTWTAITFAAAISLGSAARAAPARRSGPTEVKVTWVAVADWIFKVGDVRIYMDGALTRFDPANFYGGGSGLSFSRQAVCPDRAMDERLLDALGGDRHLDFIITGHSNLDHAYDTATLAKLTGAHIIGAPSTCFQAIAQGVRASRCTPVHGGETFDLGNDVTVRVVHWNHSGNASSADLHDPLELTKPPTPDANGCFRPGVLEDFPNGGGGRGYLFTAGEGRKQVSWFYTDTGSDFDFDDPIVVNRGAMVFPSPRDNLIAAMRDAHLSGVDLSIGSGSLPLQTLVVPLLRPAAFIPNHLGSFFTPFLDGLQTPFSNPALAAYLDSQGTELLAPQQYLDAWKLDAKGVVSVPNRDVKRKLGF
jgi:hypothetical protein